MRSMNNKSVFAWMLAVCLLAFGCGVPQKRYNGDITRLRKQIDVLEKTNADLFRKSGTLHQRISDCRRDKATCERSLAAIKSQGAALDANLANALKRIRSLEAIAARQRAVFDRLRSALEQLVKAGKLRVAIVRGQFTVMMSDKILFDSGKYAIKQDAEGTLRMVTNILRSVAGRRWQVAGHTDSDGGADYNWRLSGNRALAVTNFMIADGMPEQTISFAGYGKFQPTAPNDSKENKALNRRIELVLIPNLEHLLAPFKNDPKK